MKFYSVDLHIAIISDLKQIFEELGHSVDFDSLSMHSRFIGTVRAEIEGLPSPNRFLPFGRSFLDIDQAMCDRFYNLNRGRLSAYDGFVVSYPPAFAMLFEKFEKPIIVVSCTRFDYPAISVGRLDWLKAGLERLYSKGQLIPVANNRLDAEICNTNFSFEWKHIPSLCNYMPLSYEPKSEAALPWFRGDAKLERLLAQIPRIDPVFSIRKTYDRDAVRFARAVVHIPYQLSIMSAFEHYAQAIPMALPSKEFLESLSRDYKVLSEVLFRGSSLKLPNDFIGLGDWYDSENFKGVVFFDSWKEMGHLLEELDWIQVSNQTKEHHLSRTRRVHTDWQKALGALT